MKFLPSSPSSGRSHFDRRRGRNRRGGWTSGGEDAAFPQSWQGPAGGLAGVCLRDAEPDGSVARFLRNAGLEFRFYRFDPFYGVMPAKAGIQYPRTVDGTDAVPTMKYRGYWIARSSRAMTTKGFQALQTGR
jgi:hypothetical protein